MVVSLSTGFIVVLLMGIVAGYLWAGYVMATADRRPTAAMLWDGGLLLPTFFNYQVWSYFGNNPLIFLAYILGSMVGTYIAARRKNDSDKAVH